MKVLRDISPSPAAAGEGWGEGTRSLHHTDQSLGEEQAA
jgi:hypothetical protein